MNAAHGTSVTSEFFFDLGKETLRNERIFNEAAGFGAEDDSLPEFFYEEPLPPTNRAARFRGDQVHGIYDGMR
jgi:aldehyde:ferredoxin oxidoreductase